MLATLQDILDTVKANNLTYHQKLMTFEIFSLQISHLFFDNGVKFGNSVISVHHKIPRRKGNE